MLKERTGRPSEHCPNLKSIVRRGSGDWSWATITRLWYDGCEIETAECYEVGEKVEVEIRSMGSIRAAVSSIEGGRLSVRFIEEPPV